MATPSKTGKYLIEHNCQNGVYNLGGSDSTIKPLGYLTAVQLEKNIQTKDIYGDGSLVLSVITDKGLTGNLNMTCQDADFDKDLGFAMAISGGTAQIQVLQNKNIAIGFETYLLKADGTQVTKKCWLFNCQVSPASDSLSQDTDSTNENEVSYAITVKGVNLKDAAGTSDYTDANGNTIKVYKMTALPTDTGYATFLDSVPTPKVTQ